MMYSKILKWNQDETRDYHGRWTHGSSIHDIDIDALDKDTYDLPPARYRNATPDYEEELAKPRGAKKLYLNDPKSLVDTFTRFKNDGCLMESHPTEMARKWKAIMGDVHPHEVLRAFLGTTGLHNHNMSQLAINLDETGKKISVATHGEEDSIDVHGARATALSRFIHMGDPKYVEHSLLKLESSDQGGGVVKKMYKACVPLYDKLGLKHITLCANIDGGAYAWAKYGFEYFDATERKNHLQEIKQAIFTQTKGKKLTADAQDELDSITKVIESKGTGKTVWSLADMQTPALDQQFKSTISKTFKKNGNFMKLLFLGKDGKGSRWSGKMGLEAKSPSRARLAKYVGL